MLIVRELTGGLYFGARDGGAPDGPAVATALDTLPYAEHEIRADRAARVRAGARPARRGDQRRQGQRARHVAAVADGRRRGRPRVPGRRARATSSSIRARCCSSRQPADFDVIVTENLFGDILSDEAAVLAGLAGHAAVGVARRAADGARHVRPVRADPRLGAGHRRAGHRQPDRRRSCRRRCCCAGRSGATTRPTRSRRPSSATLDDGWRTGDLADAADPDDGLRGRRHDRASRPRSSSALEAGAAGGRHDRRRCRRTTPVVLYDTTLRDGTQGENITLSLADKLRIARMLDEFGMPYIEGGWPGSNPKDIEFFAAARTMTLGARRSWPRSARPATARTARRRPEPARAGRRRDAGRDDLRQELAAPRDRGPGRDRRPRTWT